MRLNAGRNGISKRNSHRRLMQIERSIEDGSEPGILVFDSHGLASVFTFDGESKLADKRDDRLPVDQIGMEADRHTALWVG